MLVLDQIALRVAGRLLLDSASAQIPAGARVGMVGRNGTGKTTLFRAISGELAPESGTIFLPARVRIGRLSQEAPDGPQPLIDIVLAADTERTALLAEAKDAGDPHRIAEIQVRLADIAAHAAPARAAAILAGLGFSHEEQQRPVSDFSGGWRMRVALASLLFSEPDLLLLDEPTNFLDLEGTLWLEDYLARYPRTVVIISHDRDLLDVAVNWILHLENGKLTLYRGGYSAFERQRSERQALDLKLRKKQEAERKHLQSFIDRFRAKATKARQAQSRMKILARMEPVAAVVANEVQPIVIPSPAKLLSPPIIALEGVSTGYDPDKPVLRRLSLRIDDDDRIALLGANGNGKSTFAKLIAGRLEPFSGRIVRAERLDVGYFAQHQIEELRLAQSPYDHVRALMPDATEAKVRAKAAQIGFPGQMAETPVENLSGGEKARLMMGLATFNGPHLVILDEPTNHLDIDSRAALVEAVNDYPGAVILISHDRYLLEACADRLWLVADGSVQPFPGDLDDYRRLVLSGLGEGARSGGPGARERVSRSDLRRAAAEKRVELAPLRQRIRSAEAEIARLTAELKRMDRDLAAPDLYARDPVKAGEMAKARAAAASLLARVEDDWLGLIDEYESAASP